MEPLNQTSKAVTTVVPETPQRKEKACRYCIADISAAAKVCASCRMHQRWVLNYFRVEQLGILIASGLLILSTYQFRVALDQRTKADEALQRASAVEQLAKETQSLLNFNLLLTKALSDDRKAFDELWTLSQTPLNPSQDLARRAVEGMLMSNIELPLNHDLVNRLQGLNYTELLQYYRHTPQANSPSILYAADGNKHMAEEVKVEFIAIMIDEDESWRLVQRACLVVRERLENYQQVDPARHDRVVAQCQVYGKLWDQLWPPR